MLNIQTIHPRGNLHSGDQLTLPRFPIPIQSSTTEFILNARFGLFVQFEGCTDTARTSIES